MSKIPISKGEFESWLSANAGKRSKSVLYEQKYQNHHRKIRNKENMSEEKEKASSSFVSMVNPRPTAEDFEKYDADRRLREKARDMRIAQRSASSSARNSFSMTPEPKETSPTNDQYFTPQRRSSDGLDDEFVTPSTSKKEKRRERTPGSSSSTPVSTKPPRHGIHHSSDQQSRYSNCLSRKMDDNFSRMQTLVFSGQSLQEARHQVIAESSREASYVDRSPRRSTRRTVDDGLVVNRSSSQPPPIESLNMFPRMSRPESPSVSNPKSSETPILRTSYVDTLVSTHQVQIQYADQVVAGVERQMTKLESMKNLAALSRSPAAEEAKRKRIAADALRKLVESNEQKERKLEVVRELKERIEKITNIQMSIHQLVSSLPFEADPYLSRLLNSLDGWVYLPFHEFDVQTAREKQALQRKMMTTFVQFKNIASMHRKGSTLNKSLNTSRKSIAMKIIPSSDGSIRDSSSDSSRPPSKSKTREAATQVTARLAETAMTQTSPRRVGVERLDLSSLQKINTSSQTTPKEVKEITQSSSLPAPAPSSFSITEPTSSMADIDQMLNDIVLHNESLETIDSFSHFKSDISYPIIPSSASEQTTPRSARVSLDSESARRLSAGLSHYLENIKKEQESFENKDISEEKSHESVPVSTTPTKEEIPIVEEKIESTKSESQTPPSIEESELDLNVNDNDTTQYEHEMEEQEEQRLLRENAMTPTPPRENEVESTNYSRTTTLIDPEDEQDEMRKFSNSDEFERSVEDEQQASVGADVNESADDSGFLLDNKPAPRLKSIFDNVSTTPTSSGLRSDTPRLSPQADESTFVGMDMEEYCQNDFLNEMGPIMVKKAIEFQHLLRGLDWISAQSVWKPPSFEEIHMDYYDHFDYFDSYSILIWGAVVDLINQKYLKFGRKMTEAEELEFEKEALEMLQKDHGPESKKKEWCREVKMSKKLSGMMPYELDYRYDVRRGLSDVEKQKYQWQQVQMTVIADRYPRKKLIDELNEIYIWERDQLGLATINRELKLHSISKENAHETEETVPKGDDVAVSDV